MTDSIMDELRARAADPPLRIDWAMLSGALRTLPPGWALVTQVEPLAHLDPALLAAAGTTTHLVDSLTIDALDRLVTELPPEDAPVVGLGGGMALDAAKWCGWRTGRPLILVPGVVSVEWNPTALGMESATLREALVGLRAFVRAQHSPHSIIDEADFGPASADALHARALGPTPSPLLA